MRNLLGLLAVLVLFAAMGVQFKMIRDLKSDIATLQEAAMGSGGQENPVPVATIQRGPAPKPIAPGLEKHLNELDQTVAQHARAFDQLMERGYLSLSEDKIDVLTRRVMDTSLPKKQRLAALALLRRNDALTDEITRFAVSWLAVEADPKAQHELLKSLEGNQDPAYKQSLLSLMSSAATPEVRAMLMEQLRPFLQDPQIESLFWDLAQNNPDKKIRQEAEKILLKTKLSDTSLNALRLRALAPGASSEDRLLALRFLTRAKAPTSDVVASLAQQAQTSQNPSERARLFRAFGEIGDPALVAPIVYGLSDSNPEVRKSAAENLSTYAKDPTVQQWLLHVAQNDADAAVREKAARALEARKK